MEDTTQLAFLLRCQGSGKPSIHPSMASSLEACYVEQRAFGLLSVFLSPSSSSSSPAHTLNCRGQADCRPVQLVAVKREEARVLKKGRINRGMRGYLYATCASLIIAESSSMVSMKQTCLKYSVKSGDSDRSNDFCRHAPPSRVRS